MWVCTEGKERTLGEYEALLQRVGFADVCGCRTDSPLDAVMAVKREIPAGTVTPEAGGRT